MLLLCKLITFPREGCEVLWWMSVHTCNSKITTKLQQIFCACCLWWWLWLSPPVAVLQYVIYTFGFVDDVMFSSDRASGPESSPVLCLEGVCQVVVPVGRQTTTVFARVHQIVLLGQNLLSTTDLWMLCLFCISCSVWACVSCTSSHVIWSRQDSDGHCR